MSDAYKNLVQQVESIDKRLQKMEDLRISAGNRIRISGIGDNHILIEAEEPETVTDELREWITETEQKLRELELTAGTGINICRSSEGTLISTQTDLADHTLSGAGASTVTDTMPDFPFRVRINGRANAEGENTELKLCGSGSTPGALVFIGIDPPKSIPSSVFNVSSGGTVYLEISASDSTSPDCTVAFGDPPDPDETRYVVPLAKVDYGSGKAVVHQLHFGNIYVAGRIV